MLKFAFWAMNIGLMAMCVISLLPVGLMQTWASVDKGYWYARSPEFMHTEVMQTLRWLRVPGRHNFCPGSRRPGVVRGRAENGTHCDSHGREGACFAPKNWMRSHEYASWAQPRGRRVSKESS